MKSNIIFSEGKLSTFYIKILLLWLPARILSCYVPCFCTEQSSESPFSINIMVLSPFSLYGTFLCCKTVSSYRQMSTSFLRLAGRYSRGVLYVYPRLIEGRPRSGGFNFWHVFHNRKFLNLHTSSSYLLQTKNGNEGQLLPLWFWLIKVFLARLISAQVRIFCERW